MTDSTPQASGYARPCRHPDKVAITITLDPDKAAALWANATWNGRDTGPAFTLEAIVQGSIDALAERVLAFYRERPHEMQRARREFSAIQCMDNRGGDMPLR